MYVHDKLVAKVAGVDRPDLARVFAFSDPRLANRIARALQASAVVEIYGKPVEITCISIPDEEDSCTEEGGPSCQ